jgi:hypothetical protein
MPDQLTSPPHQLRLGHFAAKASYQFAMGMSKMPPASSVECWGHSAPDHYKLPQGERGIPVTCASSPKHLCASAAGLCASAPPRLCVPQNHRTCSVGLTAGFPRAIRWFWAVCLPDPKPLVPNCHSRAKISLLLQSFVDSVTGHRKSTFEYPERDHDSAS